MLVGLVNPWCLTMQWPGNSLRLMALQETGNEAVLLGKYKVSTWTVKVLRRILNKMFVVI